MLKINNKNNPGNEKNKKKLMANLDLLSEIRFNISSINTNNQNGGSTSAASSFE